jgi:hypothetical protein
VSKWINLNGIKTNRWILEMGVKKPSFLTDKFMDRSQITGNEQEVITYTIAIHTYPQIGREKKK